MPRDAGANRVQSLGLRGADDVVNLLGEIIHLTDGKGTRHVGMVAVIEAAVIEHDQIALLQLSFAGNRVAHCAVRAGANDRIKRGALASETCADIIELGGNALFGHAGMDAL